MARIAGVNIPSGKPVGVALTYIYGLGRTTSEKILSEVDIEFSRRVNELSDAEVAKLRETIDRTQRVEGELRRDVAMNIKRLMDLGCYKGLRHRKGLPVRGQNTQTNARTRKGAKKTVAGKKKVLK